MHLVTADELREKTKELKLASLKMCEKSGIGYPSSSFSCAEILVTLYYHILRYDSSNSKWSDRDRFVMSKGHGSNVLYKILQDIGFISQEDVDRYMQTNGNIGVLLETTVPGAECSGGSLGIGFGVAAGIALGAKINRQDFLTFTLIGDGESMEGSIWEAAMFAGHHRLNNLVAFLDRNYLCKTGFTEEIVQLEPLEDKWRAFGWDTRRINGHEISEIMDALAYVRAFRGSKPLMIIADTVKGNGIDYMENQPLWHGTMPKGEKLELAYQQLQQ